MIETYFARPDVHLVHVGRIDRDGADRNCIESCIHIRPGICPFAARRRFPQASACRSCPHDLRVHRIDCKGENPSSNIIRSDRNPLIGASGDRECSVLLFHFCLCIKSGFLECSGRNVIERQGALRVPPIKHFHRVVISLRPWSIAGSLVCEIKTQNGTETERNREEYFLRHRGVVILHSSNIFLPQSKCNATLQKCAFFHTFDWNSIDSGTTI